MVKLKINDKEPMKLYCDNKTFISIAHNPMPHDKTKHMEINWHFIKEKKKEKLVYCFLDTIQQITNILTKGLPRQIFDNLMSKLGIVIFLHHIRSFKFSY